MFLKKNIVVDEKNNNVNIFILIFYRLKVIIIKELCVKNNSKIFIFELKKNDWFFVDDLRFDNNFSNVFHVIIDIIKIFRCF